MTKRVTILQEYVPAYRVPLFAAIRAVADARGIEVKIAAGEPNGFMSARGDADATAVDVQVKQREVSFLGKRIVFRKVFSLYRGSDLVVVEQARRNVDVYAALIRWPTKVAMWGHGRDFTKNPGLILLAIQKALTTRARWFFGYTPESVDAVIDMGFPASRTTVLWNSTDTTKLRADLANVSELEVEEFRNGSSHVALFVGGLDASKRLDLLIAASDAIADRVAGFKLVIGGAGALREMLSRASASRPWVHLAGPLAGHKLAIALKGADVMVMPGRVGLVAVDALVAGLPLVTTTWPLHGPERAYLDESNSVTADQTPTAYASAVVDLLNSADRIKDLRAGCEEPASRLSVEAMAERFVDGIEASLAAGSERK